MGKKRRSRKYFSKRINKYFNKNPRNCYSAEYTKWRYDVKKRDNFTCQWPGCNSRKRIQVHHIKTWAKYPAMRYVIANGITLCKQCHDKIQGKEHDYETFFIKILEIQMINKIKDFKKNE